MPRLTDKVFTDLAIWMTGFGVLIGLVFPPFCLLLGLPAAQVLNPVFYLSTLSAGLIVGAVNYALARMVVGLRLKQLAARMNRVQAQLVAAHTTGDWSGCNPLACALPVDSGDEVGTSAAAFNSLITTLARSHHIETATRDFAQIVASHLDLDDLGRNALAAAVSDTGASAGLLLVERAGSMEPLASLGISDTEQVSSNPLVAEVLRSGQIKILDIAAELVIDSVLVTQTARQVVIAPLLFKGVPLGAMLLASVEPFSPSVELLVRHFQTDLGLALSNALSHDRLERLAALDPLTDAYNRRFGLVRLQEEFGRSMRVSAPLGILMVDLDHFKAVNDTYGHLVGDRVLRAAASAIRRVTREGDVLIRYGGEEFLVVVPGAGSEDVRDLAERVRRAVAATEVRDGERQLTVTASVGASTYPEHDVSSALELVEVADTALYASKESGRNRVTMA